MKRDAWEITFYILVEKKKSEKEDSVKLEKVPEKNGKYPKSSRRRVSRRLLKIAELCMCYSPREELFPIYTQAFLSFSFPLVAGFFEARKSL